MSNNSHRLLFNIFFIQDIDECQAGTHKCQANATCINTAGGYNCTCNPGYGEDGFNCTGKNDQWQSFLRYIS